MQKQVTPAMAERVTKGAQGTGRVQVVMDKGSTRLVVREGACADRGPSERERDPGGGWAS